MRAKTDIELSGFLPRPLISAKERGNISENKVKMALGWLRRRLLIVNYIHAAKIRALNKQKIDFVVIVVRGAHYAFMPLQVKSSEVGLVKHKNAMKQIKRNGKRVMFDNIPAIVVHQRDSIEDLCIKILNAIRKYKS